MEKCWLNEGCATFTNILITDHYNWLTGVYCRKKKIFKIIIDSIWRVVMTGINIFNYCNYSNWVFLSMFIKLVDFITWCMTWTMKLIRVRWHLWNVMFQKGIHLKFFQFLTKLDLFWRSRKKWVNKPYCVTRKW